MNIALILIGVGVAAFCIYWFVIRKRESTAESSAIVTVYSDVEQSTPQGAKVYSQTGKSAEFLAGVDEALTELFTDCTALGYSFGLTHREHTYFVLDNCVPSPESRTPSFRIRADNYDGTIFDQDPRPGIGYVLASEYVIKNGNAPTANYVICGDMATLPQNARYGAEHWILYKNDLSKYYATETHLEGGHPLIT